MMHKLLIATGIFAVAVIAAAWFMLPKESLPTSTITENNDYDADNGVASSSTASSSTTPAPSAGITMAQVTTHNSESSCWAAINGKVYDLTQWINQHPGGPEAILGLCGTDGSAAFNAQHGGERRPAQELSTFYIGDLSH